jgi:hypothetical protein
MVELIVVDAAILRQMAADWRESGGTSNVGQQIFLLLGTAKPAPTQDPTHPADRAARRIDEAQSVSNFTMTPENIARVNIEEFAKEGGNS